MGARLRNKTRAEGATERMSLKVPSDIVRGSYRWRAYLYANLFTEEHKLSPDDRALLVDLYRTLLPCHTMPWLRRRMMPLDASRVEGLVCSLMETACTSSSADVVRAALWQRRKLLDGQFYTDDFVVEKIPYVTGYIQMETQ